MNCDPLLLLQHVIEKLLQLEGQRSWSVQPNFLFTQNKTKFMLNSKRSLKKSDDGCNEEEHVHLTVPETPCPRQFDEDCICQEGNAQ
jgi:hypothetical protein